MEGFQNRTVVVQLSQGCVQCYQKAVVDTRMSDIVTNRGDEESQGFKRPEEMSYRRFYRRRGGRASSRRIRRQAPYMDEKVERGLQNIHDVAKVMIGHEAVVGSTAGEKEAMQLVCTRRSADCSNKQTRPSPYITEKEIL